jgi:hypothetical protein
MRTRPSGRRGGLRDGWMMARELGRMRTLRSVTKRSEGVENVQRARGGFENAAADGRNSGKERIDDTAALRRGGGGETEGEGGDVGDIPRIKSSAIEGCCGDGDVADGGGGDKEGHLEEGGGLLERMFESAVDEDVEVYAGWGVEGRGKGGGILKDVMKTLMRIMRGGCNSISTATPRPWPGVASCAAAGVQVANERRNAAHAMHDAHCRGHSEKALLTTRAAAGLMPIFVN